MCEHVCMHTWVLVHLWVSVCTWVCVLLRQGANPPGQWHQHLHCAHLSWGRSAVSGCSAGFFPCPWGARKSFRALFFPCSQMGRESSPPNSITMWTKTLTLSFWGDSPQSLKGSHINKNQQAILLRIAIWDHCRERRRNSRGVFKCLGIQL
jgi:hypothetical protein